MNNIGTRNTNGEGGIYEVILKIDRKHNRKDFVCEVCKNCKDWSACNNRKGTNKCQKCIECTECLKKGYCDRFYCYKQNQAQISINGKQTTVATSKTRKESVAKMKETEAEVQTNSYIRKEDVMLITLIKNAEESHINIKGTTKKRNKNEYRIIEKSFLNQKPFQKLTMQDIIDFFDSKRYLSQSELDKLYNKINMGCNEAMDEGLCTPKTNPIRKVPVPISIKEKKEIIPFELDEFHKLIVYLLKTDNLIKNNKSNIDSDTIRNIILLTFLTLTRISETLAYFDNNIDFGREKIIINQTLSEDEDGKRIMSNTTKTGYSGKGIIDFDIFDSMLVKLVLQNQIKISKANESNKDNLLFCTKDGNYISHRTINNIFKRICREAGVKLDLITGCHSHMMRHTGVSFLIAMGYDLYFISKITRHKTIRELEKTYAHILDDYMKRKLKNPKYKLRKKDIITPEIKKIALKFYNAA